MEDDKNCVYKVDDEGAKTGSSLGCHDEESDADDQITALNIAEKDGDKKKSMYEDKMDDYHTPPVTSFSEYESIKDAESMMYKIKHYASMLPGMIMAILDREDITDKQDAIENAASEFVERIKSDDMATKQNTIAKQVASVKEPAIKQADKPKSNILIWKEDGVYKWLAVYSNNIIDKEQEIISSDSHKNFVDLVDKGLAPLPELWLWHRPEWKWGQATQVAYDDSGFALATGYVDKGCEAIAEWIVSKENMPVSHGMPPNSIIRDDNNPLIINRHITREISPLLNGKEANSYTGFAVLKEDIMAIPQEKREALLKEGLSEDVLNSLEAKNQATQKEVQDAGLATKEEEQETKQEDYVTLETMVEALGKVTGPVLEVVKAQQEQIETLTKELKELKLTDEDKIKAQAALTPQSSLDALLKKQFGSLFSDETEVKENELKSVVKETEFEKGSGLFFVDWANKDNRRGGGKNA